MHRQVATLLSTSSPGRLAVLGTALGSAKIDVKTTGGAEWKHSGPITLTIKDDDVDQLGGFADVMEAKLLPYLVFRTIEVHLKDEPGSLGAAAAALGNINIYAVTILESDGENALVGFGVRPKAVGNAIKRLRKAGYEARRRRHPDDTDDPNDPDDRSWEDDWDRRTERLLPDFDKDIPANDPKYYRR
jgi:hypothetical protein